MTQGMAGPHNYHLVGGPQDGARIVCYEPTPHEIYVGSKWMGDGFASWGREQCDRFPIPYVCDGDRFVYNAPPSQAARGEGG